MNRLGRELTKLRSDAGLTPQQVEQRSRGQISGEWVLLCEGGRVGRPSVEDLRILARIYRVPPWNLLKAAGYVTDKDALDGVAAARRRAA